MRRPADIVGANVRDRLAFNPEIRTLLARIERLERERADAVDRNRLLRHVQEASSAIVAMQDPAASVALLLRAMREPLGFSRAIFFSVARDCNIEARWQIDGSDAIEPSVEEIDAGPGSVLLGVLRGEPDAIGRQGELSAPLVDVRRWYVLCALTGAEGPLGVLYVDGHASNEPRAWEARLVRYVASVAAKAIENGALIARTRDLATRDFLTGLYNRRAFEERLHDALQAAARSRRSCAYVMVDVDDFKQINDRHGHAHGDDVLRKVATTLVRGSRVEDIVARNGGDEFAVLICDADADLARTLVSRLSTELGVNGLRCSLGAALFPRDATDGRSLMEAADRALYNTKAAGKNGFSFY